MAFIKSAVCINNDFRVCGDYFKEASLITDTNQLMLAFRSDDSRVKKGFKLNLFLLTGILLSLNTRVNRNSIKQLFQLSVVHSFRLNLSELILERPIQI